MLQRTGEAETITTHYIAALGIYRTLYIPNWVYRSVARRVSFARWVDESGLTFAAFFVLCTSARDVRHSHRLAALRTRYWSEHQVDPIAVIAGLVQTGLYADFFYVYFTK